MSLLADWRKYFQVDVASEHKSSVHDCFPNEINLLLDRHAIELISEYFSMAERRFEDGETYHDSFNWNELKYFLRKEGNRAVITVPLNVIISYENG